MADKPWDIDAIRMLWWIKHKPAVGFFCDAGQGAGPMAAECCAKTLLPKLLRNMSAIPQAHSTQHDELRWFILKIWDAVGN